LFLKLFFPCYTVIIEFRERGYFEISNTDNTQQNNWVHFIYKKFTLNKNKNSNIFGHLCGPFQVLPSSETRKFIFVQALFFYIRQLVDDVDGRKLIFWITVNFDQWTRVSKHERNFGPKFEHATFDWLLNLKSSC